MTAQLRHQLTAEGPVVVTVQRPRFAPLTLHVQPDALKRFAWGVLNDLDPEEAEAVVRVGRRIPHYDGRGLFDAKERILLSLRGGCRSSYLIARHLDADTNRVSVELCRLRLTGLVRSDRKIVGRGNDWEITPSGTEALERLERARAVS